MLSHLGCLSLIHFLVVCFFLCKRKAYRKLVHVFGLFDFINKVIRTVSVDNSFWLCTSNRNVFHSSKLTLPLIDVSVYFMESFLWYAVEIRNCIKSCQCMKWIRCLGISREGELFSTTLIGMFIVTIDIVPMIFFYHFL